MEMPTLSDSSVSDIFFFTNIRSSVTSIAITLSYVIELLFNIRFKIKNVLNKSRKILNGSIKLLNGSYNILYGLTNDLYVIKKSTSISIVNEREKIKCVPLEPCPESSSGQASRGDFLRITKIHLKNVQIYFRGGGSLIRMRIHLSCYPARVLRAWDENFNLKK